MKTRQTKMSVLRFLSVLLILSISVSSFAATYAEGVLSNGLRVVIASEGTHSTTTITLTMPLRLVQGYDNTWRTLAERWCHASPLRSIYSLPTMEQPVLVFRSSLEEDLMALPEMVNALRETKWIREVTPTDDPHVPSPRWFYSGTTISNNPPLPNDCVLALNGTQQVDALWQLVRSAFGDWNGKASLYRFPASDTVPRLWYRHRAGEGAQVVMFQPAPPLLSASDAALRALVSDERLERRLYRVLSRGETGAYDVSVGLYPPLAPQWLWCVVDGTAEETPAMLREINLAWNEFLATPFQPSPQSTDDSPRSRDRKMIDYCMAKIFTSPAVPADSAEFRKALRDAILPERWTYLITTDTARCKLPETVLHHEW